MKMILLLMVTTLLTMSVQAQAPWKMVKENPCQPQLRAKTAKSAVMRKAGTNDIWWGYLGDADLDELPFEGNLGYSSPVNISAAINVEMKNQFINGSTIKGVRFWLGDDISAINSDITVWISTSLPSSPDEADYKQTIANANISPRLNEVELTTPYNRTTIEDGEQLYIGYTFSISKRAFPVMSAGADVPGGFFFNYGQGWIDFYDYGYGNLALQLLIEGNSFPKNSASIGELGQIVVKAGETKDVPVVLINEGIDPITSVEFEIRQADGSLTTVTKTLAKPLAMNEKGTVSLTFSSAGESGKNDVRVIVTKVNGAINESYGSTGYGTVITVTSIPTVVPVVEEFTGTWCGWCPRGIVGMQNVHDEYGDQVVLIAVHSNDPMQVEDYIPVLSRYCDGYPEATINRNIFCDPSSLSYYIPSAKENIATGKIDLTANWADESMTAVSFNTQSTFSYSDNNGQYGVALVLVEDGMTGTGSDWAQTNYYSGRSDAGMEEWTSKGSRVSGVVFDHVAVAAWDIIDGADLPTSFTAESPLPYNFTADISSNPIIQDKTKLKAIALLIDRVSNTIINAAQCPISDSSTGISNVSDHAGAVVARYTVDGRQLSTPQKGLNIVKMANGKAMKVIVK